MMTNMFIVTKKFLAQCLLIGVVGKNWYWRHFVCIY